MHLLGEGLPSFGHTYHFLFLLAYAKRGKRRKVRIVVVTFGKCVMKAIQGIHWITVPCSQEAARLIFSLTQDSVEVKSSTDELPTIPFFGEMPVTPPCFIKSHPLRIIGSPDDITSPKLEEELPMDLLLKWADKQKQKKTIFSLSQRISRLLSKALCLSLHAIKTSF